MNRSGAAGPARAGLVSGVGADQPGPDPPEQLPELGRLQRLQGEGYEVAGQEGEVVRAHREKRSVRMGFDDRSFENHRLRVLLHAGGIRWPERATVPPLRIRSPQSDA